MKLIITFIFLFSFTLSIASPIISSEGVIFLPTSASTIEKGLWEFPIHHWVYEVEEKSISRQLSRKIIAETLELAGLNDKDTDSKNFKERIKWFLVDNKGEKKLSIKLSHIPIVKNPALNQTHSNGHAVSKIYLPFKKELYPHRWVKIETDGLTANQRKFYGEVQLIPSKGLSVISDIDDTIKISNVLDKKKLLKNIFVENYKITKGMPKLYQQLKAKGAYFHYVSASPWQLYPSLKPFIVKHYPKGTITLRYFRLKDSSFLKFFRSSQAYKIEKITAIIKRYPKHRFILIGDSGEHDPQIYANIYKRFPHNIQAIWIRYVKGSYISKSGLATVFKNVPPNISNVFSSPESIIIK